MSGLELNYRYIVSGFFTVVDKETSKNKVVGQINGADLTIRPKEKGSTLDYWVLHFTDPPGDSFSLIHKSAPISEEENLSEYIIFEKLTREEILDFMAT